MLRKSTVLEHEEFGVTGDKLRGLDGSLNGLNQSWCLIQLVSRLLSRFPVMRFFNFLFSILLLSGLSAGTARADETLYQRRWVWGQSSCFACPIRIVTPKNHPQMESAPAQAFFRAIEEEKPTIMAIYGIDGQQYNLLAHMAIGILGQESQFFQSEWYYLKEASPTTVKIAKYARMWKEKYLDGKIRPMTVNSRGPTQIKEVPEAIREHYKFDESQLGVPRNAAVATMGFLIRALRQLRTRIAKGQIQFVNDSNIFDYLPYLYFGHRQMLLDGKATPKTNLYVRNMKAYMAVTQIYELDSQQEALGEMVSRQSAAGHVAQ